MDKQQSAANVVRLINKAKEDSSKQPSMIKEVCSFFDFMRGKPLSRVDKIFLQYIANQAGVPQYYCPMLNIDDYGDDEINMLTFSNYVRESSLVVDGDVILHRYQKQFLDGFSPGEQNRFFLSASTSFGKTFLIYEILKKMKYNNVVFIFPTISLLSENLFRIYLDLKFQWVRDEYSIHTQSDIIEESQRNIFIFTPERYLSFLDKNKSACLDFAFVDEIYKLDNGFVVDEKEQESERDVAYRIALYELLKNRNLDCLLVGPYIPVSFGNESYDASSFKLFLDYYDFCVADYNNYEIVSKVMYDVCRVKSVIVEGAFALNFKYAQKSKRFVEIVSKILGIGENVIVYCSTRAMVEKYAKEIVDSNCGTGGVQSNALRMLVDHIDNLFYGNRGKEWIVSKALKKGIGVHHGSVPKYIQQEIISLFNQGDLKVLICTTTITEGVNTSAKNMVVLSGKKGRKRLKKFDAQNIAGRAGRFMYHYQGRVFILEKAFADCMNEEGEFLRHKFFDKEADKSDVDIVLSDSEYLLDNQKIRKEELQFIKAESGLPEDCFEEFKTVSYECKACLYKKIAQLSKNQQEEISRLIQSYIAYHYVHSDGLQLICEIILPIVTNEKLKYMLENGKDSYSPCYLVGMISAYISKGFSGSANYYIKKEGDVDRGIRMAADFVFNVLRYQVVKYFGLFNLLYKNFKASSEQKKVDDVIGIDSILLKLEFGADTKLGSRVSDIGASFNVVKYYDLTEKSLDSAAVVSEYYKSLDDYEKSNIDRINRML